MQTVPFLRPALCLASLVFANTAVYSAEAPANLELIKMLVDKGVITLEEGKKLLAAPSANAPAPANTLRVPYVPQSVKEDIGKQVREGVKEDVTAAVMAQAKKEGWGLPGAQPEWISRLKWSGDFRLRAQEDSFGSDNRSQLIEDYQVVNEKGSVAKAGIEKAYFNTTEDRARLRARLRLTLDAKVSDEVSVKTRLATGNQLDPVSTNQTLGSYGEKSSFTLDQAYLNWRLMGGNLELNGGRMGNPFLTTDLVWDADLAFDGVAAKWNYWGDAGDVQAKGLKAYGLAGIFPIQEIEINSQDKWLYGLEAGVQFAQENGNNLRLATTYYAYDNIVGQKNALDSTLLDYTAPKNLQRGNSVYNIRNSSQTNADELWALASDYRNLGVTAIYDMVNFAPYHLTLIADVTNNIGYDEAQVRTRLSKPDYAAKTLGYKLEVQFGAPKVARQGEWNTSFAYRHLERDAVLDAFADSDFLQGGTDNKGFILSGEYGLRQNLSVKLNYLSATSVDTFRRAKPGKLESSTIDSDFANYDYASDVIQLDLNARF